jgi:hypothetical protein
MKAYGEVDAYSIYIFLASALAGGEWSASRLGRFTLGGKSVRYPLERRLDGPQSRSGRREEKILDPIRTRIPISWSSCPKLVFIPTADIAQKIVNMEKYTSDYNIAMYLTKWSWGSVVGIATGYGLDDRGIGIVSSRNRLDRLWGPPNLLSSGYPSRLSV